MAFFEKRYLFQTLTFAFFSITFLFHLAFKMALPKLVLISNRNEYTNKMFFTNTFQILTQINFPTALFKNKTNFLFNAFQSVFQLAAKTS